MAKTGKNRQNIFRGRSKALKKEQRRLVNELGNEAKNFFQNEVFEAEEFINVGSTNPWEPSERVLNNPGDKTLQDRGELRRSIDYRVRRKTKIEVYYTAPYGVYHNNGVSPQPMRQFIGDNSLLDERLEDMTKKALNRILRIKRRIL